MLPGEKLSMCGIQQKERHSDICYSVDESWGHDALWRKPDMNGQILYDPLIWSPQEESDL